MKKLTRSLLVIQFVMVGIFAGAQSITSFVPSFGPVGTTVNIHGGGFSSSPLDNAVYFGAVRAVVNTATPSTLNVTVPSGVTYQPVSVTVNGKTAYAKAPFRLTFPFTGTITGSYASHDDLSGGVQVKESVVADFDNDGKPDIAVADETGNVVNVFKNFSVSGALQFAQMLSLPAGAGAYALAAGDLDSDGNLDLVVANMNTSTLTIYRNTNSTPGVLSLASGFAVNVAPGPSFIAIGDIDLDGKSDLAVSCHNNFGTGVVSILRNTSDPGTLTANSFASRVDLVAGHTGVWGAAITDVDGNGKPDITVSGGGAELVSIFANISTAGSITAESFSPKIDFPTGAYTGIVSWSDLDGDLKPDLIVGANSVQVFRNTSTSGSISLASPVVLGIPNGAWNPTAGDFDGDGKLDIVVRDVNGVLDVYKNTCTSGTISFSAPYTLAAGGAPLSLTAVDLDGDGRTDLVASNEQSQAVSLFRNTNTFQRSAPSHLEFTNITNTSLDGHFMASPDSPDGYIVVRRDGFWSAPLVNGTTYSVGQAIGPDVVVSIGATTSFSDDQLPSGSEQYYTCYAFYGSGASIEYVSSYAALRIAFIPGFDLGPIVTVTPEHFVLDDEITIVFDATKSFPLNALVGAETIDLWSGPITENDQTGNWNLNYSKMSPMTSLGDNKWKITMVPRDYYNSIPQGTTVFKLAMVFFDTGGHRGVKFDGSDIYIIPSPKQDQTIDFDTLVTKTVGDAPFTLFATATSELAVSFTSSNSSIISISGNTATIHSAGQVTLSAVQSGDIHYNAANQVDMTFCINPAKPTIALSGANTSNTTLTSSSDAGNQWYLNGELLPNATSGTLSISSPGLYAVAAAVDGCQGETSDDFPVIVTGDIDSHSALEIYPTRVKDHLYIRNRQVASVSVLDMSGRAFSPGVEVMDKTTQVDMQSLPSGLYILRIPGEHSVAVRFIKE